jgi:hypothetical protein
MNRAERNEKIELYGRGFDLLLETLNTIPRAAWTFKPTPEAWSIHEVIVHLADSEGNSALRARLLAAEPGRTLMAYDQDRWAVALNYHGQDVDDALQVTKYARLTTYKWLKTLPDEVFTHTVNHPEYKEPYSFEKWLDIYAGHIPAHIEQIKANYQTWKSLG